MITFADGDGFEWSLNCKSPDELSDQQKFVHSNFDVNPLTWAEINSIDSNESQIFSDMNKVSKYFISKQVQWNWVDAFTFCRANGLRLVRISNEIDLNAVLASLKIYFLSSDVEIIVDDSSLSEQFVASPCTVIDTEVRALEGLIKVVSSTGESISLFPTMNLSY